MFHLTCIQNSVYNNIILALLLGYDRSMLMLSQLQLNDRFYEPYLNYVFSKQHLKKNIKEKVDNLFRKFTLIKADNTKEETTIFKICKTNLFGGDMYKTLIWVINGSFLERERTYNIYSYWTIKDLLCKLPLAKAVCYNSESCWFCYDRYGRSYSRARRLHTRIITRSEEYDTDLKVPEMYLHYYYQVILEGGKINNIFNVTVPFNETRKVKAWKKLHHTIEKMYFYIARSVAKGLSWLPYVGEQLIYEILSYFFLRQ
eukprot:UN34401